MCLESSLEMIYVIMNVNNTCRVIHDINTMYNENFSAERKSMQSVERKKICK